MLIVYGGIMDYNDEKLVVGLDYIEQLFTRKVLKRETIIEMLKDYVATVEENMKQAAKNNDANKAKKLKILHTSASLDIKLLSTKQNLK